VAASWRHDPPGTGRVAAYVEKNPAAAAGSRSRSLVLTHVFSAWWFIALLCAGDHRDGLQHAPMATH
jgi:hypothetical protein